MAALIGLLKIALPSQGVLLCDGGFVSFNGETYRARDPLFGVFASVEAIEEGVGDEVPAFDVEFYPDPGAPVGDLSKPGYQTSTVEFHLGEFDPQSGQILGTPELMFLGQVDQTSLRLGQREIALQVSCVAKTERFFARNTGNAFSASFHKAIWPGERGHDNGSGLKVPVAWGVEGAGGRGSGARGGGGRTAPGDGTGPRNFHEW